MVTESPTFHASFDVSIGVPVELLDRKNDTLNSAFAQSVRGVASILPEETLVPTLILYNDDKRKQVLASLGRRLGGKRNAYYTLDMLEDVDEEKLASLFADIRMFEGRIQTVEALPRSPNSWTEFIEGLEARERRALMIMLGTTTGGVQKYDWDGLESRVSLGDLSRTTFDHSIESGSKASTRDIFLSLAFRRQE